MVKIKGGGQKIRKPPCSKVSSHPVGSTLYLELRPDQLAEHSCATLHNVLGHGPHHKGGGVRDVGQVDGVRVGLAGALEGLETHLQGKQCNHPAQSKL